MADKYDIYDKDGRKVGTAERQLSPYEQGERAGQQIGIWFIILMICGGFVIAVPYWIILKLARLTKRAPGIMVPLYVFALILAVVMLFWYSSATTASRQQAVADITAHAQSVRYDFNKMISVRGFRLSYSVTRKTADRRTKMQIDLPVTFTDCPAGVFSGTTITALFRGEFDIESITKPQTGEIFLQHTDDNRHIDEFYCPESSCKNQTAQTCKGYAIGEAVFKTQTLGSWEVVSEQ